MMTIMVMVYTNLLHPHRLHIKRRKKMKPIPEEDEPMDIEAQLAKLEKERDEKELLCGLCRGPAAVRVRENGELWLACSNNCKFPWQMLKQAGQLHTAAKYMLANCFRPKDSGTIPRCPCHREIPTLMMATKAVDDETKPIRGHLYFTCTKPQKDGSPCMLPKKGRWSVVADVPGGSPKAAEKRKRLENLFALDGAICAKHNKEAKNTASNTFVECEKDYQYGTGVFGGEFDDEDE